MSEADWVRLAEERRRLAEAQRLSYEAYFRSQLRHNEQMGLAGIAIIFAVSFGPLLAVLALAFLTKACGQ